MTTLPQKSQSVTATKGLLITKSSPLATESCKLEKQFITAQNLTSHYKKVLNAKSSIDTSPPKSLAKSVKARDRAKRELLQLSWANKNMSRPKSVENPSQADEKSESKSLTTVSRNLKTEDSNSKTLPNQYKLNKSMSNMVANFTKHNPNRIMLYKPKEQEKTQFVNKFSHEPDSNQSDRKAKEMLTTLLFNVHAKNDPNLSGIVNPALKAMSRLVSGHNYDVLDLHADKFKHPSKDFQPRIMNLDKSSSKLRESKYYEPPRRRKKNTNVPDKIESNNNNKDGDAYSAVNNPTIYESKNFEESEDEDFNPPKLNSSDIMNASFGSKRLTASQISLKRAAEKEEQLKYIEFLKDVTTDILERGITSNKVITNCFNYHLKKNKNRLDDRKMREILDSLRCDIGIPNDTDAEIDSNLYQTVNKALSMDKEYNKENLNEENEYLSLKKFGYPSKVNSSRSLLDDDKGDLNMSHGKKLFDDFENQIIQNIQTIRRKSSSSGNDQSRKNSIESDKSTPKSRSRQSSILKKSPNQSTVPSRKESVDSKKQQVCSVQQNNEHIPEKNKDDDDDDVFVSSCKNSNNVSINNSRRSSLIKESSNKNSVVDEDALFNDNYGEPEQESGESENEDQFNEMNIQLKKGTLRKNSSESNGSDQRSRSLDTPTPKPRAGRVLSNDNGKNDNTSDEDDF